MEPLIVRISRVLAFHQSRILRNAGALIAAQLSGRIIRFAYLLVIAALLGPAEVGIYIYGMAFSLALIPIGMFGQDVFLAHRLRRGQTILKNFAAHSLAVTLLVTVFIFAGAAIFVWATEPTTRTAIAVSFFVATVIARCLVVWVRIYTIALEQATWIPRYETLFRGGEATCGVLVLLAGGGLLSICALHFVFYLLEAFASFRRVHRTTGFRARPRFRRPMLLRIFAISIPVTWGSWMLALFPLAAIIILRQIQPDSAVVGSFGIAMQFLTVFLMLPFAVVQAGLPKFARDFCRGGTMVEFTLSAKTIMLAMAGAGILAAAYLPWFIGLVLGSKYETTGTIVAELAWMLPFYAVAMFLIQALNVMNARGRAAAIITLMVVVHAGLMLVFASTAPIEAAMLSLKIASAGGALIAFVVVTRQLGITSHAWWLKATATIGAGFLVLYSGLLAAEWLAPLAIVAIGLTMVALKTISSAEWHKLGNLGR